MPINSTIFTDGMDSDTESRFLPVGRCRRMRNSIVGSSDSPTGGAVKNEPGNILISLVLPAGNNTCIGTCENKQAESIICFIHNDQQNHSIYEYFSRTQIIEFILTPVAPSFDTAWLNFDVNFRIHRARVYDGNLIWNDNLNPPRHLRIQDAKAAITGAPPSRNIFPYPDLVGLGTTEFREQFIDQIRYPPIISPPLTYLDDTSRATNYLRRKLWQFSHRYIYYDFSKSVFSPWSEISKPQGEETSLGIIQESSPNNAIDITVNTSHPNVRRIEVMFREGNDGVWFLINDFIDKYDVDNNRLINDFLDVNLRWHGDKQGTAVPDAETIPLFDAVPHRANTLEYLNIDRIVHANYVFGYDNVDLDVSMSFRYNPFNIGFVIQSWDSLSTIPAPNNYFVLDGAPIIRFCLPTVITDVEEGTSINFIINYVAATSPTSAAAFNYIVKAADLVSLNALATAVSTELNKFHDLSAAVVVPARTCVEITLVGVNYTSVNLSNLLVGNPIEKRTTWKKGSWQNFGIVYSDAQGRVGAVNIDDNTTVYVPFHTEEVPGQQYEENVNWDVTLDMEISHLPPPWAVSYQIVYGGSSVVFYLQWNLNRNPDDVVTQSDGTPLADRIILFVPELTDAIADPKQVSVQYTFQQGDKIRFITNVPGIVLDELIEVEIFEYDIVNSHLIVENFDAASLNINRGSLFEIFRPAPEIKTDLFEEISEIFPIVNGFHQGNASNQTAISSAVVRLERGDSYLYGRNLNLWFYSEFLAPPVLRKDNLFPYQYNIESMNFSDFYDSEEYDIGRQNAVFKNAREERFTNSFLPGGRYIQGTNNNNAFVFNLDDAHEVGIEHGQINALIQVGYTLKVLQERKLTSVYIQRTQLFTSQGAGDLVTTNAIIGDIIPSNLQYGCQHPESAFRINRDLYWYDARNASILRDSPNGTINISTDYFQEVDLKRITDLVNSSSGFVLGTVDAFHNRVIFNFKHGQTFDTISFHEPSNRWRSEHDYSPDYFGFNGNTFVAILDGKVWLMNENPIAANFFGVKFRQTIKTVVNADPLSVKVFLSLAINSNKPWEAPNTGDISIPANTMYPQGMLTRFPESLLAYREGVYYILLPRDAGTPNAFSEAAAIENGRRLTGQVLEIELSNNHDDEVVLFDVECTYNKSERTI